MRPVRVGRHNSCFYCGWPLALVDRDVEHACDPEEMLDRGAAVAFGLMGMAEAIRRNGPRLVKRRYWTSELDGKNYYNCFCPGCGVEMKGRDAGVDEGTDYEWCGACRS